MLLICFGIFLRIFLSLYSGPPTSSSHISVIVYDLSLLYKHTSRHLFHEDLDVSVLGNGAQILNNVPVLQVLVKGDFFMKGLGVPN